MTLRADLVGRLAPSPSGRLHLGHAHTFVLAWLHARASGGRVLLRLEDLDNTRCRPAYAQGIIEDLQWLGIDWDGPVVSQWARLEPLRNVAQQLLTSGLAYPCVCKRADLEQAVAAPHRGQAELRYAGTCRGEFHSVKQALAVTGRAASLRLKVEPGMSTFVDGIAGRQASNVSDEVGDFVLVNRLQIPSYQLAVVVDDLYQGVTEVFRGDDLLVSTGRQLRVYAALGKSPPKYYHGPLVVDGSGQRLAKRRDDLSLASLREQGVSPQSIVAWVAKSVGVTDGVARWPRQLVERFSLQSLTCASVLAPDADLLKRTGA